MNKGLQKKFVPAAALVSLFVLALSISAYKVRTIDMPWHLAAGKWIFEHKAIPRVDPFRFGDKPLEWLDAQWLYQAINYTAYQALGEPAITLLTMAMAITVLGFLLMAAPRSIPKGLLAFVGLVFLVAMNPRILNRPEMLSSVFMAAMFLLLERARAGKTRALLLIPLIEILWANSEGLWPIGIGMVGAYLGDEAWRRRREPGFSWLRPVAWPWIAAFICVILAGLVQPYGLEGFLFPLTLLREISLPSVAHKQLITEFQPLFGKPWLPGSVIPFLGLAALSLVSVFLSGKRIRPFLFLLGLAFIYLGFSARRNLSISSVVLIQMTTAHLGEVFERRPGLKLIQSNAVFSALTIISAAVLSFLCLTQPIRTWDDTGREPGFGLSRVSYPADAADFLIGINYEGNIIGDLASSGYLIFRGHPKWKVMGDSRYEVGGEEALLVSTYIFSFPDRFDQVANRYQVEAVVVRHVEPETRKFSLTLLRGRDWALVYFDRFHAVFLHRTPRWQKVIRANEISEEELLRELASGREKPQ